MSEKVKARALSGFPEWLPEERIVELQWMDAFRKVFESYGYCSVDPRSVEECDVLVSKSEDQDTDKEVYGICRLADPSRESMRNALHFDLTVPLARYVAQNCNSLVFPFKRYQIQRAWRGERPQEGRFREFYQCDIDVIDNEEVSIQFDVEVARIAMESLDRVGLRQIRLHINNRKILDGYYQGLGVADPMALIRVMDKLDKIGEEGVRRILGEQGVSVTVVDSALRLSKIKNDSGSFDEEIASLGVSHPLLSAGIEELKFVFQGLADVADGRLVADLSIARGLDYYTGTVFEGKLTEYPSYPTIFSGGRYDDLVGAFLNRKLPGVGMSIGLTRIFAKLLKEGLIELKQKCPTQVFVAILPWSDVEHASAAAKVLRGRGFNVELNHKPDKFKSQLRYVSQKGIPYFWITGGAGEVDEVKDMASGTQTQADASNWTPTRE